MDPLVATNYIPADATSPREDVMGMVYDDRAGCWRLDVPCRHNGRATHLKASVHGPQRKTQGEAMRQWLALEEQAKNPESSLTFGEDVALYLAENPRMERNVGRVIGHLSKSLGEVRRRDFAEEFGRWIAQEEKRNVQRSRIVYPGTCPHCREPLIVSRRGFCRLCGKRTPGRLTLCDTGKRLSPATIQAYKRYAKLIAKRGGYVESLEGVTVGRPVIRRRAIEPWEMLALEQVISRDYPWFYPAFDFARTNPIRPEDQFSLTVEENVKTRGIEYKPLKTYPKTRLMAYPIVWPHQKAWADSLVRGLLFARPDGTSMLDGSPYYRDLWDRIRTKAGVKDVSYYDLRHSAVGWLRMQGVEDWRIAKTAGWSGTDMLTTYDPDNRHLIEEYDRELSHRRSTECSTGEAVVNYFHRGN